MNSNYLKFSSTRVAKQQFPQIQDKRMDAWIPLGLEIKLAELRGTAFIYFLGKQSFEKYLELEQVTTH